MAIWQRLRDEYRECPATMVLGTLWVVVFLAMVVFQAALTGVVTPAQLVMGLRDGHWFGDLTLRDLYAGQVWRAVTATFVHYGVLHIGLNLYALYLLGGAVETWYGSGPLVAIYVLTGGGGNLLSGLVRHSLGAHPLIHCGGGSTVVMGLVGLCAVVGWRQGTRGGAYMRDQMIWVILLTGGMGLGLAAAGLPVIDNWGHAGGATVGAAIGFADRRLLRSAGGRLARAAGWLGALAIAASALALAADDRHEAADGRRLAERSRQRWFRDERLIGELEKVRQTYRAVATPRALRRGSFVRLVGPRPHAAVNAPRAAPRPPDPESPGPPATRGVSPGSTAAVRIDAGLEFDLTVLNAILRLLDALGGDLDAGGASADFRRARELVVLSLVEPQPTFEEVREFDDRVASIQDHLRRDRDAARRQALASLRDR